MYSLKVIEGTERIEVRKWGSAFVPTYIPAPSEAEPGNVRKLVVPGYIFTLQMVRLANPVPPEEWQIIEALSDSHPTVVDDDGQIISGPLMGLEDIIVRIEGDAAEIRVNLLGKGRSYRIRVQHPSPEVESAPEAPQPAGNTTEGQEDTEMEYTQERIDMILADAEANGIHAAAKAADIPWQTILSWARKTGRQITPKQVKKSAVRKAGKTAAPAKAASPANPASKDNRSPLEIENAVLRERIAKLEAKIQKLQSAITELMK